MQQIFFGKSIFLLFYNVLSQLIRWVPSFRILQSEETSGQSGKISRCARDDNIPHFICDKTVVFTTQIFLLTQNANCETGCSYNHSLGSENNLNPIAGLTSFCGIGL